MRGRDFLEVATFLSGMEREAFLRTRIGRLYYGTYLEVRTWCQRHHGYVWSQSAREHGEVARLVRAVDVDLADDLAFLRTFRNAADYNLELSVETITLQLEDAQLLTDSIIARLEELEAPGTDS